MTELEIGHGRSGGQSSTTIKFNLVQDEIIVTARWSDDQERCCKIETRLWKKSEKEKLLALLHGMVGMGP